MALFGKLFEKKICDICGGEIGLLGNRKLEDGNMCKACAQKLSPFFDDRRNSTVSQIKEQLAYREANKAEVAAFRATRTFGDDFDKLLLDETAGKFVVTSATDLAEENPDVIDVSDITGFELAIDDSYDEVTYTDREGNQASYKPPHYRFDYEFRVVLRVRSPYFDTIRFTLNRDTVSFERQLRPGYSVEAYMDDKRLFDPENSREYCFYKEMAEELERLLMKRGEAAAEPVPGEPAAAPVTAAEVTCPYCGAAAAPDASGCCAYCGGPLQ